MGGALRVLLTGFEAFGGASLNPSGEIALALHGRGVEGATIDGRVLPVVWDEAPRLLGRWLDEVRPHIVISLGMARDCVEIETRATNRRDPHRRDNLGFLPSPARALATAVLPTALPVQALVRALAEDGGVKVSENAGGFLCEEVFYALMSSRERVLVEKRFPLLRAGFLHVPNDRFVRGEEAMKRLGRRILQVVKVVCEDV